MELQLKPGLSDTKVAEEIGGDEIWLFERQDGRVGDTLAVHTNQSNSFARSVIHLASLRLKRYYTKELKA